MSEGSERYRTRGATRTTEAQEIEIAVSYQGRTWSYKPWTSWRAEILIKILRSKFEVKTEPGQSFILTRYYLEDGEVQTEQFRPDDLLRIQAGDRIELTRVWRGA
jgi:hypothetical protein